MCSRLAARGIRLSPATLSYWQHGRTVPERYNSLRAVAELEDILRLPGGTLGALLPPQRPRGGARDGTAVGRAARQPLFGAGSWQERALGTDLSRLNENLTVVSTREVLHLDDRGRLSQLSVSHLVRARENGARRMVNLHCLDNPGASRVHVDPVCGRTERLHLHPESGSVLIATRFGRDLLRGETALVEYRLRPEDGVLPAGRHEHGVNSPHRAYLLQVFFHPRARAGGVPDHLPAGRGRRAEGTPAAAAGCPAQRPSAPQPLRTRAARPGLDMAEGPRGRTAGRSLIRFPPPDGAPR
ncbi:hypothetical protein IHE61_25615 [Streptomyces sp. GKU 257-1]|nr:hypothetical protein [Streptomyces sp. GKU 257-1]